MFRLGCGPKAGIEHGGRGFRAGQTGLSAARTAEGVDDRATWDRGDTGVRLFDRVQFDVQSTSLDPDCRFFAGGLLLLVATSWTGCRWCDNLVRGVRRFDYGVNHYLSLTKVYLQS